MFGLITPNNNFRIRFQEKKIEPEQGLKPRTSRFIAWWSTIELSRDLEVQGSSPGSGSNFFLEIL